MHRLGIYLWKICAFWLFMYDVTFALFDYDIYIGNLWLWIISSILPIDVFKLATYNYLSHHLFTIKIMYLPLYTHLNYRMLWCETSSKLCLQLTVVIQNLLLMATSYLTQAHWKEQGWYLHAKTALKHSTLSNINWNTVHCVIQMENGIQILLNCAIVRICA